jgi:hypothetical protein
MQTARGTRTHRRLLRSSRVAQRCCARGRAYAQADPAAKQHAARP